MHRLWISLAVLAALACAGFGNTCYLGGLTGELTGRLERAQDCAAQGDWETAAEETDAALRRWNSREGYLHTVLQHRDTDEILLGFQQVQQLIDHHEDSEEYAAANAVLITRIGLLHEMEQLNWKNLL